MAALKTKRKARSSARSRSTPTRSPVQERAQGTVDAILAAARWLLVREGLDGTTTNAIAKRAGVSIGSLYQYFAGRDAIVAELSRRHVEEALTLIFAEVSNLLDAPLAVGARRLIRLMVEVHRRDPEFHRIIESAGHKLGARAELARVEDKVMAVAIAYLERHRHELVVQDIPRAAFVAVGSIEALTHNAVLTRPELLQGEALIDDITRLVLGFLTGAAPSSDARSEVW